MTYDDLRLHKRLTALEEKLAGEEPPQPEPMHKIIANIAHEGRREAELQNALENEDSEDGVKRTAARIQIALNNENET
jgi:hypothetical protein